MKEQIQSSGVHLAYEDVGSGPAILLIHGWGVSGALFAGQVDSLAGRHRILVPDLPGHGSSSRFPPGATFGRLADCVAEFITTVRPGPLCVVGWSMGAMIAWDLLRRFPNIDIAGLVTVDMVPRLLNGPDWSYGLRDGADRHVFDRHLAMMRNEWSAFTEIFMSRILAPGHSPRKEALLALTKKATLKNDPESMASIWEEMVEQDFRADLPALDLPTLVVSGSQSRLYGPRGCQWVANHMPQARMVEFSTSGHAPNLEDPEQFNRVLSEFVDSLGPPR
ncbi:MAG: alpha/beta hydrolase [Gammaproteobacteria bacterium]|nr:alpha/beta hydrolase [Gammaproteobacteria bacterium]